MKQSKMKKILIGTIFILLLIASILAIFYIIDFKKEGVAQEPAGQQALTPFQPSEEQESPDTPLDVENLSKSTVPTRLIPSGSGGKKGGEGETAISQPPQQQGSCLLSISHGIDEKLTAANTDDEIFVIVSNNNNNQITAVISVDGTAEATVSINPLASHQQISTVMTSWLNAQTASASRIFNVQVTGSCSQQASITLTYTNNENPLD